MNESSRNETESLRSDIDHTRRRMDETMDALGNRLQGRHLVDEVLGFFRRRDENGEAPTDKLKRSADAALHSVVDTIKANPLPILAISAGAAWLIYESRRNKDAPPEADFDTEYDYNRQLSMTEDVYYDPDEHYDRPLEYPTGDASEGKLENLKNKAGEKLQGAKEAISEKASAAKEKLGEVGEKAREKVQAVRARASELGARAKESTRAAYLRSRERVATTVDRHPLEVGLGCLALGVIAGILIPTPQKVHRAAGPRMDRLRTRTREAGRELLEKGKRVAQAAGQAVQEEAQSQGLTLDRLREKAGVVADRAKQAATDTARQEGVAPELAGTSSRQSEKGNLSGSNENPPSPPAM